MNVTSSLVRKLRIVDASTAHASRLYHAATVVTAGSISCSSRRHVSREAKIASHTGILIVFPKDRSQGLLPHLPSLSHRAPRWFCPSP
ncbi:MAG: hypothetical protein LBP19_10675 [Treponema sp.]|nr:hypothetical protein [Treponema sp.]